MAFSAVSSSSCNGQIGYTELVKTFGTTKCYCSNLALLALKVCRDTFRLIWFSLILFISSSSLFFYFYIYIYFRTRFCFPHWLGHQSIVLSNLVDFRWKIEDHSHIQQVFTSPRSLLSLSSSFLTHTCRYLGARVPLLMGEGDVAMSTYNRTSNSSIITIGARAFIVSRSVGNH